MTASDLASAVRIYAPRLIEDAAGLATIELFEKPHLVETYIEQLRTSLQRITHSLDAYEQTREASVEIAVPTAAEAV